jgi:hypothetical protein
MGVGVRVVDVGVRVGGTEVAVGGTGVTVDPAGRTSTSSNHVCEAPPPAHFRHDSRKIVIRVPVAVTLLSRDTQFPTPFSGAENSYQVTEGAVELVPPVRSMPNRPTSGQPLPPGKLTRFHARTVYVVPAVVATVW